MSGQDNALPPAAAVHAALRKITEVFAAELDRPTSTEPDWSVLEWALARAVATMHGVSPLLGRRASWRGFDGWTDFLEDQRAHTEYRQVRILELLRRIDQRAREAGIAVTALKGSALHALGLYEIGERPMSDIDLLVRPRDAQRTAQLLRTLRYRESYTGWKERVFTPIDARAPARYGEHSNNDIKIELHERIFERLPSRPAEISEFLFPLCPHPGLNAYPSKAALMAHLLLHAAGTMVNRSLRLIQLHDMALLASRMAAADWNELLEYRRDGTSLWWALPPLRLTMRYYPREVPPDVANALKGDCQWHLDRASRRRTLSDVSFSHLWVDAFPGIEWSRSIAEMIEYAIGRIRPNAQYRALRGTIDTNEAWASDWSRLSQTRRVLAWLTSRPTRPVTMHVVRAALGTPNE